MYRKSKVLPANTCLRQKPSLWSRYSSTPTGTLVYAPADGVATLFEPDMYFSGGTMLIDHGHGVSSTFLHLSKGPVEAGTAVKQGQLVAEIGATGRVTGAHLNWRINWFKEKLDPALLVPKR